MKNEIDSVSPHGTITSPALGSIFTWSETVVGFLLLSHFQPLENFFTLSAIKSGLIYATLKKERKRHQLCRIRLIRNSLVVVFPSNALIPLLGYATWAPILTVTQSAAQRQGLLPRQLTSTQHSELVYVGSRYKSTEIHLTQPSPLRHSLIAIRSKGTPNK